MISNPGADKHPTSRPQTGTTKSTRQTRPTRATTRATTAESETAEPLLQENLPTWQDGEFQFRQIVPHPPPFIKSASPAMTSNTRKTRYPWIANLFFPDMVECSGTIIGPHAVITGSTSRSPNFSTIFSNISTSSIILVVPYLVPEF